MAYYSALKKEKTLPLAVTRMKLEGITLSKRSPTGKVKHCMISLVCGIETPHSQNQRVDQWLPGERGREQVTVVNGHRLPVMR